MPASPVSRTKTSRTPATLEMGTLIAQARGEVPLSADILGIQEFVNKKLIRVASIGATA